MPSIRTFVRPLAVALSLAFAAVPATALADSSRPAPADAKEGKEHGKGQRRDHDKKDRERPQFPLEAAKFQQIVDKRIAKAREHMERALDKHNVPDLLKAQIRKEFDAGAAQIQAAAKRVEADGTVTKEEAKEVRDLVKSLKRKAR
ncbi:MAG: hypothetical protein IT372_07715, partial [Polyangiaceae bacterium]|nr:hypothetical protein [Polyangiaceae bacterium]